MQYSWEPQELKPLRYFFVGFLALALGFWVFVGISLIKELNSEKSLDEKLFYLFVFCIWTITGAGFSVVFYFLSRPSKPAVITLSSERLEYQTGYSSSEMIQIFDKKTKLLSLIRSMRNRNYTIQWSEIYNLQLRRIGVIQKLFFNYEDQKIDIGKHLTEPEQEWLYKILCEKISTEIHL